MTKAQVWKDLSVTEYILFCKLKLENVTHEADYERSWKRQNDDLRRFRGAQRSHDLGSPNGWLIWFKCRTVRVYRGFSLGQTCEILFVRGTISFYNEKLQFLHAGRSAIWNASNVLK